MENKRKATGANGIESSANDPNDRAAKRRKLVEEFGDLSNGETTESTTAYGLSILESIRATTDKNGRPVSPYFEKLPSRSKDPEYYKKIRLPLSLESIEQKLKKGEYTNLSALEGDLKRMVQNSKEVSERNSTTFGDAERVRKAVSNLMTKHNPAYKTGSYTAVATPLPPTPEPEDNEGEEDNGGEEGEAEDEAEDEEEGGEDEEDEGEEGEAEGDEEEEGEGGGDEGDEDAEDEGDKEKEASVENVQASRETDADEAGQEDEDQEEEDEEAENNEAEGEDGEEEDEIDGIDDEDEEADEDNEDEEDEDGEDGGEPSPAVRKRRRPGRPPKNPVAHARKIANRGPTPGKADTHYEGVPYKGLTFQQAQEKIVEELLRKKDDTGEYPYFEPFIYLPPRSLKDYYEIIKEPLSLKALQKQVRGQHGRGGATYVTDFKSWLAFEDQASLIWKNAYHYNEDGSEISLMAQELEKLFQEQLKEAKLHVPEPPQPQPKIKLKMPPNSETPVHPKKITIHVGGKNSATGSPAPATGQSGEEEVTRNGTPVSRNPFGGSTATPVSLSQLEKARSMSASAGPPSPSAAALTKSEDAVRPSPAFTTHQHFAPPVIPPASNAVPNALPNTLPNVVPNGDIPTPPPAPKLSAAEILEAQKYRPRPIKQSEAIMPSLVIMSHPELQIENRMLITIPASPTETQQELVLNAPTSYYRLRLKPEVASFLEAEQREWKLNVIHNGARLYPPQIQPNKPGELVFDVTLQFGLNRIEVSLVAALPKGQKAPNGLTMEMEKFVVHLNVLRH
ncbi:Bromodomain-containing protein [Daldinia caldariorum]|uniref:Bromodomain-containing protein n=1 Tax=Daldinia caldariorum TaxID=326644 RepID=UPI0020089729|nr:Bromodomain-containing protein [Daldinia caldariorum]KAI1465390.1 Bromodomain-containing protein [Daldinia caldariorum]